MENLTFRTPVGSSLDKVKEGFNVELFKALKPPLLTLEVARFDGCKEGDEVHLKVGLGLKVEWISLITKDIQTANEWSFIDEGKKLPFPLTAWRHHHRVIKSGEEAIIIDDINFRCGPNFLTKMMKPLLYLQFVGRAPVYRKVFGNPTNTQ